MHTQIIKYLTALAVTMTSVCIANYPNPHGGTGCDTSNSEPGGMCFRYCTGSSGKWCYTARNCSANNCYYQNSCSGAECPPTTVSATCVKYCPSHGHHYHHNHCDASRGSAIVCEDFKITLHCQVGKVVKIISANFGRTEPADKVCSDPRILTTNCTSPGTKDIVSAACENMQICELFASDSVFGDPCVNTYKYLEIEFSCVAPNK